MFRFFVGAMVQRIVHSLQWVIPVLEITEEDEEFLGEVGVIWE